MKVWTGKKKYITKQLKNLIDILKAYEGDADVEIDEDLNITVKGDLRSGYKLDWRGKPQKKRRENMRNRKQRGYKHGYRTDD